MFKPEDRYVHFTKYGGINFGEVKWFGYKEIIDGTLGIHYRVPYISTIKNFSLSLDGSDGKVYKISHDMTPEELEKWTKLGKVRYSKEYTANEFAEAIKKKTNNDNNIS
jgi:hypothetical protein